MGLFLALFGMVFLCIFAFNGYKRNDEEQHAATEEEGGEGVPEQDAAEKEPETVEQAPEVE